MELYGRIKNKKGGFPTLNPTPYVFTKILPLFFNDLEPSHSQKWFKELKFDSVIRLRKREKIT